MTIRPILTAPDPRLKAVSEPIAKVDDETRKLADDLLDSRYAAVGIGLAVLTGRADTVREEEAGTAVSELEEVTERRLELIAPGVVQGRC